MNKVIEIGNLVNDVELKELSTDHKIANFTLAVKRKFRDEKGEPVSDFFRCVVWNKVAENMAKFTHKGDKIAIYGALQNREYEANGEKRYITEINVEEVEFINTKKKEEEIEKKVEEVELKPVPDDKLPF